MVNVLIYGAGSIGNHLAYGCRSKGWNVTICDIDKGALNRTRKDIYPSRYGAWDDRIRLVDPDEIENDFFEFVIIGTPPDTHLKIANQVLRNNPPKVLLLEKPVCTPDLVGAQDIVDMANETGTFVCVGYNHTLTPNSERLKALLNLESFGEPLTITAKFREHWGGIFGAHPWLSGPESTYLGFSARGGGASGEHSHAINLWQYLSSLCGKGRIVEVAAFMDMIDDGIVKYDSICQLHVRTEQGLIGTIVQDVITEPAQKKARIQSEKGFIEWRAGRDPSHDAVCYCVEGGEVKDELISKTRPRDFEGELDHIGEILTGAESVDSPIALWRGLDTMLVIAAAHLSATSQRTVQIRYEKGYTIEALEVL